jgi:hypothetical protein
MTTYEIDADVYSIVSNFLSGPNAARCREAENGKLYHKLSLHMLRQAKLFKFHKPGVLPKVQHLLAAAMTQEKYWHFIQEASEELIRHCSHHITVCLLELQRSGIKLMSGSRMRELVCGMLYMLKTGLHYNNRVLLYSIPEVVRCLPNENKIQSYFGISSKVICMTENEVKLRFRDSYQP